MAVATFMFGIFGGLDPVFFSRRLLECCVRSFACGFWSHVFAGDECPKLHFCIGEGVPVGSIFGKGKNQEA